MKVQILLAVLACLALSATAAVIDPIEQTDEISPVIVVETAEEVKFPTLVEYKPIIINESEGNVRAVVAQTTAVGARNLISLGVVNEGDPVWFRISSRRIAVPNTILIQEVIYTGRVGTIITAIRVYELGEPQGPTAEISTGGLFTNSIGVKTTSAVGHGFDLYVDIYGFYIQPVLPSS